MPKQEIEYNLKITFEPETKRVLSKLTVNLETIYQLLKQNRDLLAKALQSSLEIVKTPLDGPEGVSGEVERDATQT